MLANGSKIKQKTFTISLYVIDASEYGNKKCASDMQDLKSLPCSTDDDTILQKSVCWLIVVLLLALQLN